MKRRPYGTGCNTRIVRFQYTLVNTVSQCCGEDIQIAPCLAILLGRIALHMLRMKHKHNLVVLRILESKIHIAPA